MGQGGGGRVGSATPQSVLFRDGKIAESGVLQLFRLAADAVHSTSGGHFHLYRNTLIGMVIVFQIPGNNRCQAIQATIFLASRQGELGVSRRSHT